MNFSNKQGGRKNLQEKGYYIVLVLCVLAVGISGYIFVSTAVEQNRAKEKLSVPITAEKLPDDKDASAQASADTDTTPTLSREEQDALLRQEALSHAVAPLQGEQIQNFSLEALSYNETTKDWRLHTAVDIASESGQVCACMDGTVTEIYDDALLGNTVVIRHDGGMESRYSGLAEELSVKVGDMLQAGDAMGALGETGILESASPRHLHFQLLIDGQPVDPTEIFS